MGRNCGKLCGRGFLSPHHEGRAIGLPINWTTGTGNQSDLKTRNLRERPGEKNGFILLNWLVEKRDDKAIREFVIF